MNIAIFLILDFSSVCHKIFLYEKYGREKESEKEKREQMVKKQKRKRVEEKEKKEGIFDTF